MSTLHTPTKKPGRASEIKYADDLAELQKLKQYLCSAAIQNGGSGERRGAVKVEVCRTCEAQCAYGRKYVQLWDQGVRPVKRGRPPKAKNAERKEETSMPRSKKACDEMTLQEQLEAKVQENMQLHEANRTMITETLQLTKELEETKEQLEKRKAELDKMAQARNEIQVELWKLKAKLYDKEHEWED